MISKRNIMNSKNFITLTIIISGLVLNPLYAEKISDTIVQEKSIDKSLKSSISLALSKRGIEKEVALKLAKNLVNENDNIVLTMLIKNLEEKMIISSQEVVDFLSKKALKKESINFQNYDFLVGMISQIKKEPLDKNTLQILSEISKQNQQDFA